MSHIRDWRGCPGALADASASAEARPAPTAGAGAESGDPAAGSGSPAAARWLFWGVAYVYVVLLTGTNLPTPLYRGYERAFGFSPLVVTLIFSAYVGTLIPSLLLAGPLSDAIGRRRVLLPAVGVALAGAVCFALADGTGWLFAARAVQGVAVGAASGALTAALVELEPNGNRPRAAMVSAMALFAGIGAGPLLAGALAQYTAHPRVVPYLVEIALLALALGVIWRIPGDATASRWRPRRPQIPRSILSPFTGAATMGFLAGAVTGLFLTLVPSYLLKLAGSSNLALAGAAVALMFGASAASQYLGYGRTGSRLRIGGLGMVLVGFVLLIGAGSAGSLPLLLSATGVAGVGQGLAFLAAVTEINHVAPAQRRADVLSSFYLVTYLGTGLPVIGAGFLATAIGLLTAVRYFAAVMAGACLIVLAIHIVRHTSAGKAPGDMA
jgi:predicted MFS family arabinose efflux permease